MPTHADPSARCQHRPMHATNQCCHMVCMCARIPVLRTATQMGWQINKQVLPIFPFSPSEDVMKVIRDFEAPSSSFTLKFAALSCSQAQNFHYDVICAFWPSVPKETWPECSRSECTNWFVLAAAKNFDPTEMSECEWVKCANVKAASAWRALHGSVWPRLREQARFSQLPQSRWWKAFNFSLCGGGG